MCFPNIDRAEKSFPRHREHKVLWWISSGTFPLAWKQVRKPIPEMIIFLDCHGHQDSASPKAVGLEVSVMGSWRRELGLVVEMLQQKQVLIRDCKVSVLQINCSVGKPLFPSDLRSLLSCKGL